MKKLILIISNFLIATFSHSQNIINCIESIGIELLQTNSFGVSNNNFKAKTTIQFGGQFGDYKEEEAPITKSITKQEIKALKEENIFEYFDELQNYDTPLERKLFEENNTQLFREYRDSIRSELRYYNSKLLYTKKEKKVGVTNFNLDDSTFTINQTEYVGKQINLHRQAYILGTTLPQTEFLKQKMIEESGSDSRIQSKIKITDLNLALMVERAQIICISIYCTYDIYEEVSVPLGIYISTDDSILLIQTFDDSKKKYLIEQCANSRGEIKLKKDSIETNKPFSIGYGERRSMIVQPDLSDLYSDSNQVLTYRLAVNSNGDVKLAKINFSKSSTKDLNLINKVGNILMETVKYNKVENAQIEYHEITVRIYAW